jgi:hypothetical protein
MGTRTVSLLLAICAAGVWAPAHAQNADTSVVKLPQDTKGFPEHRNMRRCSATLPSPGCTSTASNLCRA